MDNIAQQIYGQILNQVQNLKQGVDISPILPAIAEKFDSSIDTNMLQHGRWDGNASNIGLFSGGSTKWKPLAASTKKSYLRKGITNLARTLDRNAGGLRSATEIRPLGKSAIEFSMGSGSKGGKKRVSPKVYSAIQNFGGDITIPAHTRKIVIRYGKSGQARFAKRKAKGKNVLEKEVKVKSYTIHIPASPFMVLQKEDVEFAFKLLTDYVAGKLGL